MKEHPQTLHPLGEGGIWAEVFEVLTRDSDNEYLMIDTTSVRAHQQTRRKRGNQNEALERSRGGLSTKIHLVTDAWGRPMRFIVTGDQVSVCTQVERLLVNLNTGYVIADKGYDSERVLQKVEELGAVAVIPPRTSRKVQREYDRRLYKERNLIERTINKLKRFRRLTTR
jgi:transposase